MTKEFSEIFGKTVFIEHLTELQQKELFDTVNKHFVRKCKDGNFSTRLEQQYNYGFNDGLKEYQQKAIEIIDKFIKSNDGGAMDHVGNLIVTELIELKKELKLE